MTAGRVPRLDDLALRTVALCAMIADHVAVTFLVPESPVYAILRLVGRMAFPIFALGVAEGASRTHDWVRYALRLLALAVVSEVPFDLVMSGTPVSWGSQDVVWTLLLGLLACRLWQARPKGAGGAVTCCLGTAGLMVLADLAGCDYGDAGVLLVTVLWGLGRVRDDGRRHALQALAIPLVTALVPGELPGTLADVPLAWARRDSERRMPRWLSYGFYPAHLLAIWAVHAALATVA